MQAPCLAPNVKKRRVLQPAVGSNRSTTATPVGPNWATLRVATVSPRSSAVAALTARGPGPRKGGRKRGGERWGR